MSYAKLTEEQADAIYAAKTEFTEGQILMLSLSNKEKNWKEDAKPLNDIDVDVLRTALTEGYIYTHEDGTSLVLPGKDEVPYLEVEESRDGDK